MRRNDAESSERLTRQTLIDPQLERSGWSIVSSGSLASSVQKGSCAIAEYPTANGPADYALASDGKVVGIVEAKKLALSPQGVLTQAERYARGLPGGEFDFNGLRAPFLYSTNGIRACVPPRSRRTRPSNRRSATTSNRPSRRERNGILPALYS